MAEREVWGFKIRTSPSGKRIWPSELKREATRRLREEGMSLGSVAAELDAHECLVRKWWVADRSLRWAGGGHFSVRRLVRERASRLLCLAQMGDRAERRGSERRAKELKWPCPPGPAKSYRFHFGQKSNNQLFS